MLNGVIEYVTFMMLKLSSEFENVTWYGRGPEQNYIDRNTSYDVGVYN
jgi:beta-galactosidase